jgi:hypothetical protein
MHGYGILFNYCGEKSYEGEFIKDERHGRGILYRENGDRYIGEF